MKAYAAYGGPEAQLALADYYIERNRPHGRRAGARKSVGGQGSARRGSGAARRHRLPAESPTGRLRQARRHPEGRSEERPGAGAEGDAGCSARSATTRRSAAANAAVAADVEVGQRLLPARQRQGGPERSDRRHRRLQRSAAPEPARCAGAVGAGPHQLGDRQGRRGRADGLEPWSTPIQRTWMRGSPSSRVSGGRATSHARRAS